MSGNSLGTGGNQFRVVPEEPRQDDQPPEMLRPEPAANQGPGRSAAAGVRPATPAPAPQMRPNVMRDQLLQGGGYRVDQSGRLVKITETVVSPKAPKGRRGPPMAQVTRQGTVSPNLGLLADALGEQQQAQANITRAFQRQEEAKAKALQDTSDLLAAEANRLAQQRETAMQDAIERSRKLQAQADELGAMAPSAGRLFGSDAQAASFGAALSIAAGAMLSARTGGENVALKIIDRAIQRDMESQREAIKNKQFSAQMGLQLAQEMRAAFRDDMVASEAMQATLLRYTENRLQAIISQTNDQVLRARGEEAIANLRMQYAEKIEAATRGSFGVTMAMPLRQAQAMLAASQGQDLPPISTHDMQRDAAQGGGEATQEGLGAAAAQKADEAREDAAKAAQAKSQADQKQARANKLKRRGQRKERPQQPTTENPLARWGVKVDPDNPGTGILPDGSNLRVPLGAVPLEHAGQGRQLWQRIRVPDNYKTVVFSRWQRGARPNEWVRVGAVKQENVTPKERQEYEATAPREVTILDTVAVSPDLPSTEVRGGRRVRIPPYPGIDKDLTEFNTIASDLSEWKSLYDNVISQFDQSIWKDLADKKADARVLAAIALFNRNISQGGVLNTGEVTTIGSFLDNPSSWSAFANKGGWEAMDEMMREHYSAKARKIQNFGNQPALNTRRAQKLKRDAKNAAIGSRGSRGRR